jgi:hypothetical protein
MSKLFLCCLVVLMLTGCSAMGQGPAGGHGTRWYLRHQSQMRQEISWCNQKVSRSRLSSCRNAASANQQALGYNAHRALDNLKSDL